MGGGDYRGPVTSVMPPPAALVLKLAYGPEPGWPGRPGPPCVGAGDSEDRHLEQLGPLSREHADELPRLAGMPVLGVVHRGRLGPGCAGLDSARTRAIIR